MAERTETDSLGKVKIPDGMLYGAQTSRAVENFRVSGWGMPRPFIRAIGMVKKAAAMVNRDLGKLDETLAGYIISAAEEVILGNLDDHFVVDVFQTGSGTSTNMNVNEVIGNRAIQLAGGDVGSKTPIHPNDHVNMGQSSNDVIPTAMRISVAESITSTLMPSLNKLENALKEKAKSFDSIVKTGRTHLQDATPVRLGQVFDGYASQVKQSRERLERSLTTAWELPIGGTAVGTGVNTHPEFGSRIAEILSEETGLKFREADDHFEAQAANDVAIEISSGLKAVALSIGKIANDIRFLASGPRCGLGELELPVVQPGSSIMPGKVNPVILESVMQVSSFVVGADACITHAVSTLSNFELSVSFPVTSYMLLESTWLLSNACGIFTDKCIAGLEADAEHCESMIDRSIAMATGLAPLIGYDKAAQIAKKAYVMEKTVREIAIEDSGLDETSIDKALDARKMTEPDEA